MNITKRISIAIALLGILIAVITFFVFFPYNAFAQIQLPTKQVVFSQYSPIEFPVTDFEALKSKPIGVGSIANGGVNLNLNIAIEQFSSPVDMYFALYSAALDPDEIYLFAEDGSIKALSSSGLTKFRSNKTTKITWVTATGDCPTPKNCKALWQVG